MTKKISIKTKGVAMNTGAIEGEVLKPGKEKAFDQEAMEAYYNQLVSSPDEAYTLHVKKQMPGQRQTAHCYTYQVSDYTFNEMIEKTTREFGPGEYRLMVYRNSPYTLAWNHLFIIAEKISDKKPAGVSIMNGVSENDLLSRLLAHQEKMFMELKKGQQSINWIELLKVGPGVLVALKELMPQRKELDPLQILQLVKEFNSIASNPDNAGKPDNMSAAIMKALDTFGKPLVDATKTDQQQKIMAMQQQILHLVNALKSATGSLPAGTLETIQSIESDIVSTPQQPTHQDGGAAQKIKEFLGLCVRNVQRHGEAADPDTYAAILFDQLEEDEQQQVYEWAGRFDEVWPVLLTLCPGNENFTEPFKQVLKAYITSLLATFCEFFVDDPDEENDVIGLREPITRVTFTESDQKTTTESGLNNADSNKAGGTPQGNNRNSRNSKTNAGNGKA